MSYKPNLYGEKISAYHMTRIELKEKSYIQEEIRRNLVDSVVDALVKRFITEEIVELSYGDNVLIHRIDGYFLTLDDYQKLRAEAYNAGAKDGNRGKLPMWEM